MTRWARHVIRVAELDQRKVDLAGWVAGKGVLVGPPARVEQYLRKRIAKLQAERRAFTKLKPWRRTIIRLRWEQEEWVEQA